VSIVYCEKFEYYDVAILWPTLLILHTIRLTNTTIK